MLWEEYRRLYFSDRNQAAFAGVVQRLLNDETEKQKPYLTGIITFPDGATAKVALWHYKPRKKEESKEFVG